MISLLQLFPLGPRISHGSTPLWVEHRVLFCSTEQWSLNFSVHENEQEEPTSRD